MKYLPILLAITLIFTACSHIGLKSGVKKPATSTVTNNEQPANTPATLPSTTPATTSSSTAVTSSQAGANAGNPSGVKLTINALDGIRGEVGKTYRFSAQPEGIPLQAAYTYYVNESQLGSGNCNYIANFVPTAVPVDPYVIKVTAQWNTSSGMQTASASTQFIAEGKPLPGSQQLVLPNTKHLSSSSGGATMSLYIPSDADGPNGSYTFVAQPQNIPAGAMYTWYINGTNIHSEGIDAKIIYVPANYFIGGRQYSIKVVADWQNGAFFTTTADGIFTCYR